MQNLPASAMTESSGIHKSLFELAGQPIDLAQQALDFLFGGASKIFGGAHDSLIHRGLLTLLSYFSSALLIFAVLIVVYHLIAMVSESAHYGVAFGRRNKQLWAPVRLVLALGLLVPVGGYSTAQYLVMQAARMGSGLASNVWNDFITQLKPRGLTVHGTSRIDPTATIAQFVAIGACVKSYEIVYSGLPVEQISAVVADSAFLLLKDESSKRLSRVLYQTKLAEGKGLPINCGNLSWVPMQAEPQQATLDFVTDSFTNAHLAAIKSIQATALNLGGRLALASLGIVNASEDSYVEISASLRQQYRETFSQTLEAAHLLSAGDSQVSLLTKEKILPPPPYGWLMAGTTYHHFALTDGVLFTPDMAMPTVNFQYSLFAAFNDKATLQIVRSLSFAHLFLQNDSEPVADTLWFNPTLNHNQGPLKQAFTLMANLLARQDAGNDFDRADDHTRLAELNIFKPIALGFRALDLADQFWAVAEWSPRTHSSIFGVATIFGNLAQGVRAALISANPRPEAALVLPPNFTDLDQPSDFARYLMAILGCLIFIPAAALVFILPILPLITFVLGGLLWLLAVLQGILVAPLWALTFLSLRGDGAFPEASRLGLTLIFTIFLRPVLMVGGFIIALLLMHVGFTLLDVSLDIFGFSGINSTSTSYALGALVLLLIKLGASYIIAHNSLHCIGLLPDIALRWLGATTMMIGADAQDSASLSAHAGAHSTSNSAAGAGAGIAGGQQLWQQKVLVALETMAGQPTSSGAGMTQNASLFAHVNERSEPATGTPTLQAINVTTPSVTVPAPIVQASVSPDRAGHASGTADPASVSPNLPPLHEGSERYHIAHVMQGNQLWQKKLLSVLEVIAKHQKTHATPVSEKPKSGTNAAPPVPETKPLAAGSIAHGLDAVIAKMPYGAKPSRSFKPLSVKTALQHKAQHAAVDDGAFPTTKEPDCITETEKEPSIKLNTHETEVDPKKPT
jgi:hypothetical protein